MSGQRHFKQFSANELTSLSQELRESGLDSFQCDAVLTSFLANKGYGVSSNQARLAVLRIGPGDFTLPRLQLELEKLAYMM